MNTRRCVVAWLLFVVFFINAGTIIAQTPTPQETLKGLIRVHENIDDFIKQLKEFPVEMQEQLLAVALAQADLCEIRRTKPDVESAIGDYHRLLLTIVVLGNNELVTTKVRSLYPVNDRNTSYSLVTVLSSANRPLTDQLLYEYAIGLITRIPVAVDPMSSPQNTREFEDYFAPITGAIENLEASSSGEARVLGEKIRQQVITKCKGTPTERWLELLPRRPGEPRRDPLFNPSDILKKNTLPPKEPQREAQTSIKPVEQTTKKKASTGQTDKSLSTSWLVWAVLIVAAIGLLWLLLKKRK